MQPSWLDELIGWQLDPADFIRLLRRINLCMLEAVSSIFQSSSPSTRLIPPVERFVE